LQNSFSRIWALTPNKRQLLIGGLIVPADKRAHLNAKNNEAILLLPNSPTFALRKPLAGFNADEILIALSLVCGSLRLSNARLADALVQIAGTANYGIFRSGLHHL
jgi:hypothetical protein